MSIKFFSKRRARRQMADRAYGRIVEQARNPLFYSDYGIPDTVEGRFELILLHLFLVVDRLTSVDDSDAELARLITEAFVTDMDHSLREMGVGDVSVGKRVNQLYRAYGGRLDAYRRALAAQDDGKSLQTSLLRNFDFPKDGELFADKLQIYLVEAIRNLQIEAVDAYQSVKISFPDPGEPNQKGI